MPLYLGLTASLKRASLRLLIAGGGAAQVRGTLVFVRPGRPTCPLRQRGTASSADLLDVDRRAEAAGVVVAAVGAVSGVFVARPIFWRAPPPPRRSAGAARHPRR